MQYGPQPCIEELLGYTSETDKLALSVVLKKSIDPRGFTELEVQLADHSRFALEKYEQGRTLAGDKERGSGPLPISQAPATLGGGPLHQVQTVQGAATTRTAPTSRVAVALFSVKDGQSVTYAGKYLTGPNAGKHGYLEAVLTSSGSRVKNASAAVKAEVGVLM